MTQSITWHPDDANLMSFAAGSLAEPLAAVVAAHLELCPRCRRELRAARQLGGILLSEVKDPIGQAVRTPTVMPPAASGPERRPPRDRATGAALPWAIEARYGVSLATVAWKWLAPGIRQVRLPLSRGVEGELRLLKIEPGVRIPDHAHGGTEMTLVLQGAYRDVTGRFRRGDVQDLDGETEHEPQVEPGEVCVCLVAAERPAKFRGLAGRLLRPWTGM